MKKILLYTVLVGVTVLILLNPAATVEYASRGLNMCYEIIIPSLFPFFVCSGLLIYSGFCEVLARVFQPVMKPLFNINGSGAAAFVLGIISGYPLGAVTTCQLYENSYVSKSEAERLLAFCNNSGPLFILGSVGISLYGSPKIGVLLYAAHILAALCVGIIFRFYKRGTFNAPASEINTQPRSIGEIFSTVLSNSINSILTVCAAVVFFSVVSNIAISYFHLDGALRAVILGLSEFVTGVTSLSQTELVLREKLVLSAAIVGFAGLSVHIQVMGVVSRHMLRLKPYIIGKIMHGALAAGFTALFLKLFPAAAPMQVFNNAAGLNAGFAVSSLYTVLTVVAVVLVCLVLSAWLFVREARRLRRRMNRIAK